MKKVLILQNAPLFTAGSFEGELAQKNIAYEYCRLDEGIKNLPPLEEIQNYAGFIVLGGPLGLRCDRSADSPALGQEVAWLRQGLRLHKPMLAVSQGAVLLAQAQGAWVERAPQKQIGWTTAEIYPDYSRNSVIYSTFDEKRFPVLCWYDTLHGFPPTGYWYLHSPGCRYLSTGIHGNCYTFNFHPEVTGDLLNAWLEAYGHEADSAEAVENIRKQAAGALDVAQKLVRKIIHGFESFLR